MAIARINYEDAKYEFAKASIAIYDDLTKTINALIDDKYLLKIVASTSTFTLSSKEMWDLNIVFNPDGDGYLKGKAELIKTRDLDDYKHLLRSIDENS